MKDYEQNKKEKGTQESRSNAGRMRKQNNNNNKYPRIYSYYLQKDRENIASTTPEKDAMMKEQNQKQLLILRNMISEIKNENKRKFVKQRQRNVSGSRTKRQKDGEYERKSREIGVSIQV